MNPAQLMVLPGWTLVWTSTGDGMNSPKHWICLGAFDDHEKALSLRAAFNAALADPAGFTLPSGE